MSVSIKEALEFGASALSYLQGISSSNLENSKSYVLDYLRKMHDKIEREIQYGEEVKRHVPEKPEWGRTFKKELETTISSLKSIRETVAKMRREIDSTRFDGGDDNERAKKIEEFKSTYEKEIKDIVSKMQEVYSSFGNVEGFAEGVRKAA